MRKCDYCGQFNKVREETSIDIGGLIGNLRLGTFICEKCDKAFLIRRRIESKKRKEQRIKQQEKWRKERDKILIENGK